MFAAQKCPEAATNRSDHGFRQASADSSAYLSVSGMVRMSRAPQPH